MGVIKGSISDAIFPLPLIPSREGRGTRGVNSSREGRGKRTGIPFSGGNGAFIPSPLMGEGQGGGDEGTDFLQGHQYNIRTQEKE